MQKEYVSDFTHSGIICRLDRRKRDHYILVSQANSPSRVRTAEKKCTVVKSRPFPVSRDSFATAVESSVAETGKTGTSLHLLYQEKYTSCRARAEVLKKRHYRKIRAFSCFQRLFLSLCGIISLSLEEMYSTSFNLAKLCFAKPSHI